MRREIHQLREVTEKPFSVNVLPAYGSSEDVFTPPMLKMMYEEKVPVATYVGDVVPAIFEDLKKHDVKIIYRPLNPTVESVQAAEKAGADIVVATGFDEGGSLPNLTIGTFSIVPMIVDAVSVPVMAAGGISTNRGFRSAMALGAEGVYCGTLFLMSEESRMADNVKAAVAKATARDLLTFRSLPAFYRSLPGELADELMRMDLAGATNEEIGKKMGGFSGLRVGMLEGDMNKGYVSVGNGITYLDKVRPVAEIMCDLTAD